MADTNALFDQVKADFDAAIAREVQIRSNYEQGLIPTLERDLQAARQAVEALTKERDSLLKWKQKSEAAFLHVESASRAIASALDVAPSPPPLDPPPVDDGLPPSWR